MEGGQDQFVVVAFGEEKLKVSKKIVQMSELMHNLLSLELQDEQIQIPDISKETFKQFVTFCQLNNFQQPKIPKPIKTNSIEQVLDSKNVQFLKDFAVGSPQFKQLVKASSYLGSKPLQLVLAVPIACLIYFQDSKMAFQAKCKQLNISEKIQFQDEEKFRKLYPFMN